MNLIKPPKLRKGDTIATVSLSWGGAGDDAFLWRYHLGKKRLQEVFGHCEPKYCIPYGAMAEINCNAMTFSILESGCSK